MILKNMLRKMAQRLLGFERYLFVFARLGGWRMRLSGYEREFRFFISLLPQKGIILDVGANIGITTVAFAKRRSEATVYAFEPVPVNLGVLHRMIRYHHLKNVQVFDDALGDSNGFLNMIMPVVNNVKMQGLSHVVEEDAAQEKGETFSVPVKRLDDMEELAAVDKIIAIKLDVENYEYFVLQGALQLIQKHKPAIYCELWGNKRKEQCIALMKREGYTVKVYTRGMLADYSNQETLNFFFLPE